MAYIRRRPPERVKWMDDNIRERILHLRRWDRRSFWICFLMTAFTAIFVTVVTFSPLMLLGMLGLLTKWGFLWLIHAMRAVG